MWRSKNWDNPHEVYKAHLREIGGGYPNPDAMEAEGRLSGVFEQGADAMLKELVELLKRETVGAWGGNRIILDETWRKILKEAE